MYTPEQGQSSKKCMSGPVPMLCERPSEYLRCSQGPRVNPHPRAAPQPSVQKSAKKRENYSIQDSRVVPHRSTD